MTLTPILTVLFQCCTRKVYFSLLFLVISTFALLMYFSILKWKNSRKRSLLMVILQHLLIVVSNHFLIKCITLEIKVIYVCLPFTGHHGLQIRSQLQKFLSSAYPHISLRVVFRPSFRLSNFFPFKDNIPCEPRSHVVYLYKCQCCGALYVGQTRRHIHTRISEHMGDSPLTGKKRSVSTMSGILAHIHPTKHQISPSDFKILSTATSSDAKSPGFTGSLPVWNLTSRSPGERTKSPGIHVGPIVLSVINSENPKKYKRYKQLVLKSSKCINLYRSKTPFRKSRSSNINSGS